MRLEDYSPRSELIVPRTEIPGPAFPVVDFHGHFGPLYSEVWKSEGMHTRHSLESCVAELRSCGIERAVNLDGWMDGFRGARQEDFWRAMEAYPDFFIPFVVVDTTRLAEPGFERHVRTYLTQAKARGARGVKLFKVVTLSVIDREGRFHPGRGTRLDDPRLDALWASAGELGLIVLPHVGDPRAFFRPMDRFNERYEELLAHPEWRYHGPGLYAFEELLEMQENLLTGNPGTTFVIPHGGSHVEDLAWVDGALSRHPNMHIDIAERISEFGRAPYSARRFFLKWQDRILFGSDAFPDGMPGRYPPYFRFLETWDEHFDPGPYNARWKIYGLGLPPEVLGKIYRGNALRLLGEAGEP